MKTQWTAVLVLALMVGGITFVSVYLGGGGGESSGTQSLDTPPSLTFPIKVYPQRKEEPSLATEVRHHGHQDFWFVNESGQDLRVGLNAKGCTCSEVEINLAPDSWRAYSDRLSTTQLLQLPLHRIDGLTMMVALNTRDRLFPDLPPEGNAISIMLTKENEFKVPAGAFGRVRLSWEQQLARKLSTYADLWIGQPGGTVNARLDAHVYIMDPVVLPYQEVKLPPVSLRQLENLEKNQTGQQSWIVCGSMTRTRFRIQAELVHENTKAESDPLEIGEPIPLGSGDISKLVKDFPSETPTILSGFKIPVTLKAHAKDGTPAEWGQFTRYVRMTAEGNGESVAVQVTGQVLGDVHVSEVGKVAGALDLGPFPRASGTKGRVILETDEKKLELELDKSRLPEYLRVSLKKLAETGAGHRSWKLEVEVPPNKARGEFPSSNNPLYRDSAVYVKTNGNPPHSIRIPVMGTANER
jgi:hypothetical protein